MKVTAVVPSWNVRDHLRACLSALVAHAPGVEVVVVDDASTDGSAELVATEFPKVRLVRQSSNRGFAPAVNSGVTVSTGEYLLLLNADCEIGSGMVGCLLEFLEAHPEYGAAAPRLRNPDGTTQRACMRFPTLRTALCFGTPLERWRPDGPELRRYFARDFDHEHDADVEQPPAACLLLRRSTFDALGGLDERLPLYFNDVDLSRRMATAGLRTRFLAAATAIHHVGASTRQRPDRLLAWHRDRLTYYRKHHGTLAGPWVKACVLWTYLDHTARHLFGREPETSGAVLRQLGRFLVA